MDWCVSVFDWVITQAGQSEAVAVIAAVETRCVSLFARGVRRDGRLTCVTWIGVECTAGGLVHSCEEQGDVDKRKRWGF